MCSTYNEGKSVVAERFIKTLKNKMYKHMTYIGKNVYSNVLDDIVIKYNSTVHSSLKIKPKDVTDDSFVEYNEESNKKDPKFKIGDHVRISKYKIVFSKCYTPNWSEEIFVVREVQNTVLWTYLINDLNGKKIIGSFCGKELQKTDQKEFRIEKVIKEKGNKLSVKWKGYDSSFNNWIDKKDIYKMRDYLTDYKSRTSNVKVEISLSNNGTKEGLKNITHVDTSSYALKTSLSALKTEVDKLDIPKLTTVPADLSKLTNKVANDLVEETDFNNLKKKVDKNETDNNNLETKVNNNDSTTKTSINNLKTKVDGIDLTKYVLKSIYDTKIGDLELKIPDVAGKLNTLDFNSKVSELETKIRSAESKPDITNLATKSSLTAVENKIPDVNGFVKKIDYDTEISSTKNDYVTNAALTSQSNDLKSQHIADIVKKVKKNISDILGFESSLKQKEELINELERTVQSFYGDQYYNRTAMAIDIVYKLINKCPSK